MNRHDQRNAIRSIEQPACGGYWGSFIGGGALSITHSARLLASLRAACSFSKTTARSRGVQA